MHGTFVPAAAQGTRAPREGGAPGELTGRAIG
jgi:hypothetical protein